MMQQPGRTLTAKPCTGMARTGTTGSARAGWQEYVDPHFLTD